MTSDEVLAPPTPTRYGDAAIVSAVLAVLVSAATLLLTDPSVPSTQWSHPLSTTTQWVVSLVLVVVHLLQGVAFVGLTVARPYGPHRLAHVTTWVAVFGFVLLSVAELLSGAIGGQRTDSGAAGAVGGLFGLGSTLTLVGGLVAGTVIIRRRAWTGLGAWSVLLTGLVILFGVFPANALADLLLRALSLTVWSLLFIPLGLALRRSPATSDGSRLSSPAPR